MTLNQHRIDFFGKSAPYYDTLLNLLTLRQYARFQKRAIEVRAPKQGENILDICSGTGRVASWIAQAVGDRGEVVGLDIAESMVEVAQKRYGGLRNLLFLQRDVTKPWDYQNYFDGVFASYALHELPEIKRQEALEHSCRALKEKGRMVIADFNPQVSGIAKIILIAFFKLFERDNLNFFSFDLNEMLRRVGFKSIGTFPVLAGMFQITLAYK